MKQHPHDEFFKYLFSLGDVVREFCSVFLPAEITNCLDLTTLVPDDTEYISTELAAVYTDKVYRCKLKGDNSPEMVIVILLEQKTFVPQYPHFQLNEYRQRIWTSMLQQRKKPVVVLPIILYQGFRRWKKRQMHQYFEGMPQVLESYIGNFDYWLVDLSKYSDQFLLRLHLGFLAYGLLTMKHSQDKAWLESQMLVIFEKGETFLSTEQGRIFVESLFVYFVRIANLEAQSVKNKITESMAQAAKRTFVSTYDKIKLEGKIEGKLEGKLEGKIEHALLVAENLMREFPDITDEKIVKLSGASLNEVRSLRHRLNAQS